MSEDTFDVSYRPFLEALMAVVDADGTGGLTADQHVRWTGALMNVAPPVARDIHRRLDTDDDGYVPTADLLQAIHDFYFDDDPDGVGSWLLGPLDTD